jgi:hypothetical protein
LLESWALESVQRMEVLSVQSLVRLEAKGWPMVRWTREPLWEALQEVLPDINWDDYSQDNIKW